MQAFVIFMKKRGKLLLSVAVVIALIILYILLVDRPVRNGMKSAKKATELLTAESERVQGELTELHHMRSEMEKIETGQEEKSFMPSYNNSKQELDFLNRTLSWAEDYYIGFDQVTRSGNQIRRGFSLQFKTKNFASAVSILNDIEHGDNRCLVGDVSFSPTEKGAYLMEGGVQVSCSATFYETVVGGTPDAELPEDSLND